MITEAKDYTDRAFTRPITPPECVLLSFDDVRCWGGWAEITVAVEYYWDNGALTIKDIHLWEFVHWDRFDSLWAWGYNDICRMKQHRLDEVVGLIKDRIREKL